MRNAIVNEEGSKQRFCRRLEMFLKTIIKAKTNKELFGATDLKTIQKMGRERGRQRIRKRKRQQILSNFCLGNNFS